MIAAGSTSYPILGAAQAAGVDAGVAYRLIDLTRGTHNFSWEDRLQAVRRIIVAADRDYGESAVRTLTQRLTHAIMDGRIYAPSLTFWNVCAPGARP